MLLGIISKLYITQGTNTINEITIGNKIVQEKDINWSKRILGKEALTHMNIKIIIHVFTPMVKPDNIPSIKGKSNVKSIINITSFNMYNTCV